VVEIQLKKDITDNNNLLKDMAGRGGRGHAAEETSDNRGGGHTTAAPAAATSDPGAAAATTAANLTPGAAAAAAAAAVKLEFMCRGNERLFYPVKNLNYAGGWREVWDLSDHDHRDVLEYLARRGKSDMSPAAAAVAVHVRSARQHVGVDMDSNTVTVRPCLTEEEVSRSARNFAVNNCEYEHSSLPFVTRQPGGVRVHLPRAAADEEEEEEEETNSQVVYPAKPPPPPPQGQQQPSPSSSVCCRQCDLVVPLSDVLPLCHHLRSDHGEKVFVCPACPGTGTYYYLPDTLRRHIQGEHRLSGGFHVRDLEDNLQEQVSFGRLTCVSTEVKWNISFSSC